MTTILIKGAKFWNPSLISHHNFVTGNPGFNFGPRYCVGRVISREVCVGGGRTRQELSNGSDIMVLPPPATPVQPPTTPSGT